MKPKVRFKIESLKRYRSIDLVGVTKFYIIPEKGTSGSLYPVILKTDVLKPLLGPASTGPKCLSSGRRVW